MSVSSGMHVVIGASGGLGAAVVRALQLRGLPVRAVNRSGGGDAAEGIVSYATDNGCQLLVIPRHGRGGLRSFFFGRVVDQVVKRSPYPVLSFVPAVTE